MSQIDKRKIGNRVSDIVSPIDRMQNLNRVLGIEPTQGEAKRQYEDWEQSIHQQNWLCVALLILSHEYLQQIIYLFNIIISNIFF